MNGNIRCRSGPYSDEELLPLSALQHFIFCKRQCALIHIEQLWKENARTLEGHFLHRRVHEAEKRRELYDDKLVLRHVALHSYELGLRGFADVIEFKLIGNEQDNKMQGIRLPGLDGYWKPYPIEYKRGRPKNGPCDEVQLCAQAICLEGMLETEISDGAIFYGLARRRHRVVFGADLRKTTIIAARGVHELISTGSTPRAEKSLKCRQCSLMNVCMPSLAGKALKVNSYIREMLELSITEKIRAEDEEAS